MKHMWSPDMTDLLGRKQAIVILSHKFQDSCRWTRESSGWGSGGCSVKHRETVDFSHCFQRFKKENRKVILVVECRWNVTR